MPLYEYACEKCGHHFEKIELLNASETKKCPKCGGKATRLLSAPAIQFKGTGWYVTDYGGKNGKAPPGDSSSESKSSGDGKGASDTSSKKAETPKETGSKGKSSKKKD